MHLSTLHYDTCVSSVRSRQQGLLTAGEKRTHIPRYCCRKRCSQPVNLCGRQTMKNAELYVARVGLVLGVKYRQLCGIRHTEHVVIATSDPPPTQLIRFALGARTSRCSP